jgi:hypothetical protein
MIIVSESSAEATRRVRTGRSTPVCSRSSAARNDTPGKQTTRPISVHAEVLARDLRPLNSPRDRPASAHRSQGRRDAASLTRWRKRHPNGPGAPTQRRPGMRDRGRAGRATSHRPCQIHARYTGDPRGTAGSHGDTDRHPPTKPPTCHHRSGTVCTAWRVKDSNLGRHAPTDLQTAAGRPGRRRTLMSPLRTHHHWAVGRGEASRNLEAAVLDGLVRANEISDLCVALPVLQVLSLGRTLTDPHPNGENGGHRVNFSA